MKKICCILFLLLFIQNISLAINWKSVTTPKGRIAYVDLDSIIEFNNYYFYNIKFQNPNQTNYTILTIQSAKSHPLSSRLKAYSEEEYKALDGDYNNITKNMTTSLEPVTFESVVNTCYKVVKDHFSLTSSNIILNNEE